MYDVIAVRNRKTFYNHCDQWFLKYVCLYLSLFCFVFHCIFSSNAMVVIFFLLFFLLFKMLLSNYTRPMLRNWVNEIPEIECNTLGLTRGKKLGIKHAGYGFYILLIRTGKEFISKLKLHLFF